MNLLPEGGVRSASTFVSAVAAPPPLRQISLKASSVCSRLKRHPFFSFLLISTSSLFLPLPSGFVSPPSSTAFILLFIAAMVVVVGVGVIRLGVFRLTEPDGMKLIQECKLKGFHVHPDGVTIYENADLKWSPVRMSVVDLR